jgi:2-polyprenyl-3-methyl-5-hydroxy-6-metoxy-1,4-benzoquinol methylase
MELIETKCPICDSIGNYTVIYKSNFSYSDLTSEVFSARRLPDAIHYQIVRCNNDNLVRSSPVYDTSIIENLYKTSKLNYTEQIENLIPSYLTVLDKVLCKFAKDAKILEVGCGNGFILKALSDRGYSNIYGIEPSSDAAAKADDNIRGKITVDFLKEGIYNNGYFNFIFFFQTLDHIYEPVQFLNSCYNLLMPGGFILALNHDVKSLSAMILGEKSPIIDIEHTHLYSKETIRKLFSKCGFRPIEIFSPKNIVSLEYLLWLMPLPKKLKLKLLDSKGKMFNLLLKRKMKLKLGNLCIIGQK